MMHDTNKNSPQSPESKTSASNKELVNMAFRVLPAYFGLCVGYLVISWKYDSVGGLWRILAVLTGMIALVSCVAFGLAGKRAYAQWMQTADDAQRIDATRVWMKTQSATRIFIVIGFLLGLGLGYVDVHDVLMSVL